MVRQFFNVEAPIFLVQQVGIVNRIIAEALRLTVIRETDAVGVEPFGFVLIPLVVVTVVYVCYGIFVYLFAVRSVKVVKVVNSLQILWVKGRSNVLGFTGVCGFGSGFLGFG